MLAAKTSAAAETTTAAVPTGTLSLSINEEPNIREEGTPASAVNFPVVAEASPTVAQTGNNDEMRDGIGIVIGADNNLGA